MGGGLNGGGGGGYLGGIITIDATNIVVQITCDKGTPVKSGHFLWDIDVSLEADSLYTILVPVQVCG